MHGNDVRADEENVLYVTSGDMPAFESRLHVMEREEALG